MKKLLLRTLGLPLALALLLCLSGCFGPSRSETQKRADANSAAGKMGKAAHAVAVETGKAAKAVGKEMGVAAREAHAGWQEAAQQDKEKKR